MSAVQQFKAYLKAKLSHYEKTSETDKTDEVAHSELLYIFSQVLPELEKEYESLRNPKCR